MPGQFDQHELEKLRNIFYFSAPVVRIKDGQEGVVAEVPDDNSIALVAFPVAVPQPSDIRWHMDRQKVPCSELKRIYPPRPAPVGLSLV